MYTKNRFAHSKPANNDLRAVMKGLSLDDWTIPQINGEQSIRQPIIHFRSLERIDNLAGARFIWLIDPCQLIVWTMIMLNVKLYCV